VGELGYVDGLQGVGDVWDGFGELLGGGLGRDADARCVNHGRRRHLTLRQRDLDAGALADLAVADLAAAAADDRQEQHAQCAGGG
jgi:hypothetical protein